MESYNKDMRINLPEMPVAGKAVADELAANCNNAKCLNLTKWLNELYLFRESYTIYRQELAK